MWSIVKQWWLAATGASQPAPVAAPDPVVPEAQTAAPAAAPAPLDPPWESWEDRPSWEDTW